MIPFLFKSSIIQVLSFADLVIVHRLQHLDQGLSPKSASALRLEPDVELPHEVETRKAKVHSITLLDCNSQIFDKMLYIKAGVIIPIYHSPAQNCQSS